MYIYACGNNFLCYLFYFSNNAEDQCIWHILLVFHRKDLCEARVKPKMSSNFQMTFADKLSDIPPHKTTSDRRWSLSWSMLSMRSHSKQMAELGQIFRWSAQLGQLVRWSTQLSFQYTPKFQMKCTLRPKFFRWSVQIQIYPPFSDEVLRWSAYWDPNPK